MSTEPRYWRDRAQQKRVTKTLTVAVLNLHILKVRDESGPSVNQELGLTDHDGESVIIRFLPYHPIKKRAGNP